MTTENEKTTRSNRNRWLTLAVVICLIILGAIVLPRFLDIDFLAEKESDLKAAYSQNRWLFLAGAFLLYAIVTGLSIPGAAVMSLLYAWFFGFSTGVVLLSFASTTGATIAFLLSRYLFRDQVETRFGNWLERFNKSLESEGTFYLFSLRLIPAVPFFIINAVMGLTRMKVTTFWWVSQLGMLIGTVLFCYAGSSVPDLNSLFGQEATVGGWSVFQILLAFGLLSLFPIIAKRLIGRHKTAGQKTVDS